MTAGPTADESPSGIEQARADDQAEVLATLDGAGADPLAWYGVRRFSDHRGREASVEHLEAVIAAEWEAGRLGGARASCLSGVRVLSDGAVAT